MTEKELLRLKEDIEEAKAKEQQLKGQNKMLLKQLKDEFDCDDIESANNKLAKIKKKSEKIKKEIDKKVQEIQEKYEL